MSVRLPAELDLTARDLPAVAVIGLAAVLLGLLILAWRWERRRRRRQARLAAITRCGFEHLRDVLVPDGQGGALHVDFLLLTVRGVVVIDLRQVPGNIFGGDQMDEWTVMQGPHRFTFANPQAALYDRVAAVRALAQDVPVEGRIVFTPVGRFPKGLPRHTLMLESLATEFPAPDRSALGTLLERWLPGWTRIREAVRPSRLIAPRAVV